MPRRGPTSRWRGWIALSAWLVAIVAAAWAGRGLDGGVAGGLERLLAGAQARGLAAPVVIGIYLVRPLVALPVTVLTVFAGFWLGPVAGTLVAVAGATTSALPPFWAARRLGAGRAPGGRLGAQVRARPFTALLTARLALLPGDLVNVVAGAWRAPWAAFLAATVLGGLPGALAGVLAGAGLRDTTTVFRFDGLALRPGFLVASAGVFAVSALGAWALRRRRAGGTPREDPSDERPESE